MNAAGIAAIVVSHGSAETLEDCLVRLRAAEGVAEIRVVDNDSRDGSLEIVQRHALADPRVRFIANPDNPAIEPGLVGADLVGEDGARDPAARRRDPDFAAMLRDRARARLGVELQPSLPLQVVDAVSGALMLLPRTLFARIGGFDEGYRLHAEDLDLCRRARASGATVACANEVQVVHVRGVSSRARPLFVEWHKHRGFWRYFNTFEAPRRGVATRGAVFAMIWGRFPLAAARAAVR